MASGTETGQTAPTSIKDRLKAAQGTKGVEKQTPPPSSSPQKRRS